ncbi:hypothetical protein LWI29_024562 [Acer saccharum]|uniref:Integrase catalytic domain-containing protein n=1 Tax=Acer saccharum TaxID=4024 RepID=A0AA39SQY0_ACESA|nr:hypothetical protein LWI29_024562 [Acer saccharum]
MSTYLVKAKQLRSTFDEFTIEQIPRSENAQTDTLASLGSTTITSSKSIPIVHLTAPTIQETEVLAPVDHGRSWMEPIYNYLQADILPQDRSEVRKIKAKAAKFCILYCKLYKKSFTGPYLRCVTPREAYNVLKSLHYEECGNHYGACSLSNRAITAGYYWPTMRTNSQNHVKSCDKCQRFAPVSHLPPGMLNSILAPWPFMKWGMDIVGKLTAAPSGVVYMLVLTDYFIKWVEVEAYQQVCNIEVRDFIWKNIICRFGVPREIVTDNGSQFISYDFKNFYNKYGIKLSFSILRYPQANEQTESTNKTIVNTLKKRLEAEKGKWAEKLLEILWSYQTTPRRLTGETPFSLVYGSEAVIPIETRIATARSENPNEE